ncbi:MAG: Transketolase 2 [Firmicutes bacterium ADurb.Bin182]|nr:MAG: Transketolase 2 [Firmicutes bacterium ADurb.Bin182]
MAYLISDLEEVRRRAIDIRADILEMIPAGKAGHLGGSCSAADITAALYFKHMNVFDDPKDPRRDRCIFSKGHAVLAQYACFVELGYVDRSELAKVKTIEGILQGHPDMDLTPGIEAVTGSLGQGLSISLGMALGLKLNDSSSRVYAVVGDGELSEGQIWEAAMAASVYKADNLCAIIDYNLVQATDTTEKVFPILDIKDKWAAFGWHVIEIDGHDIEQILTALDKAREIKGKPTAILAHTVKGKGFSFAEGSAKYHNASMTEDEYRQALAAIEQMRMEV